MQNVFLDCIYLHKETAYQITEKYRLQHNANVQMQLIRVITKLPNSEQSYKGKVKTHNYINRQNQTTTGKL